MKNEYIVSKIDLWQLPRFLGGMELVSYCSRRMRILLCIWHKVK